MRKTAITLIIFVFLPAVICFQSSAQEDLKIWKSFVKKLKQGDFPAEKIRPLHESLVKPIQGFLKYMRANAVWSEWEREPEIVKGEGVIHYIIPLTYEHTLDYSFTFLFDSNDWYLQHFETIWLDRAEKAGWSLQIGYESDEVFFHLTKVISFFC